MNIKLIKHCADDLDVVNAARVSLDGQDDFKMALEGSDAGLIKFLMRERHGSPFEHTYFRFFVEAPIFVFREWHRHRTGHSYNEMSGRYTELQNNFYEPAEFRTQVGKPGAYTYEPIKSESAAWAATSTMNRAFNQAWSSYRQLLDSGIAKEQARAVLPVGIYSKMYWSCNSRSLMHFLGLRNSEHAQAEIRELAAEAERLFGEIMPVTAKAFLENDRVAP